MGLPCVAPGPRPQNLQAQAWMEREVVNWLLPRSRPTQGCGHGDGASCSQQPSGWVPQPPSTLLLICSLGFSPRKTEPRAFL